MMPELLPWGELLQSMIMVIIFGAYGTYLFIKRIVSVGPKAFFRYKKRNVRPALLDGNTYGEHIFVRPKKSRVVIHCVANGPTDAPLMLFLHGFPEFWYSWRHQIKEFSKNYRTVAIDMRGYGDSSKPLGIENYIIDRLVADIDELITLLGYSSCVLVAHDWGGAVAYGVAAQHPDKVKQLIVGNMAHPKAARRVIKSSLRQLRKSWYVFFFQLPILPIYSFLLEDLEFLKDAFTGKVWGFRKGNLTEEDIECFKFTFADYGDLCGPVNYYRAALRYKSLMSAFHEKIKTPTLLIWGAADGALERDMAEISKEYMDDLQVKYIEEASHWVQQDCPEEFNSYMREFLSE